MAERSDGPAAPDLEEAARLWGIQTTYTSQDRVEVRASEAAVLAALGELGAPVRGPGDLGAAVRAGRSERWGSPLDPVVVSWRDREPPREERSERGSVPLRLLASEAEGTVHCELRLEDRDTHAWSVPGDALSALSSATVEGREYVTGRLPLPADLPDGYHDLVVRIGARTGRTRLIRAPARTWAPPGAKGTPREWGLFLPLYALRSRRSHGVADLTDLERLQRWTARHGGAVVGTLPLLAAYLDHPFDPSPYAPASRLFWNDLYLDPERAPGLEEAPAARAVLASEGYRRESERLRKASTVDYRAAMAVRRRALEPLARAVAPADAALPVALAEYLAAQPLAETYARFRAVGERQASAWREWPAAPRTGSIGEDDVDAEAVRYHLYVQWALDRQLGDQARGRSEGGERLASLYMDLPLGTHPDGFDVWRWRDLFADASTGAPPDQFFAGGQDWGFPPLHPHRSREDGHRYWAASLRHLMRVSGMLRLDHVMALHRLYWIPRGMGGDDGIYVRYPAEELYAVLSLESRRHRTEVVGEDLGTVPDEVREGMRRHGLRRMYVLPFELDREQARLAPVPDDAVASVGTHDTPPFRAFVEAGDVEKRVADGQLDGADAPRERADRVAWTEALTRALGSDAREPAPLLEDALVWLGRSPARLVLVSLEDLWLESEPQNRPGTPGSENWSRKARYGLDDLDEVPEVGATLAAVEGARRGLTESGEVARDRSDGDRRRKSASTRRKP